MALGVDIANELPYNDYFEYFGPDFKLHISPSNMANQNTPEYLDKIKTRLFENLRMLPCAPGVQMQGNFISLVAGCCRSVFKILFLLQQFLKMLLTLKNPMMRTKIRTKESPFERLTNVLRLKTSLATQRMKMVVRTKGINDCLYLNASFFDFICKSYLKYNRFLTT